MSQLTYEEEQALRKWLELERQKLELLKRIAQKLSQQKPQ